MEIPEVPTPAGPLLRELAAALLLAAAFTLSPGPAVAQVPGPNVNMVSGTTWPDGDPFLQRQNEPSIAVSTRNPLHLLAGANDYRTVDLPGLPAGKETGDAWLGVFRSVNGGGSWKSTLIHGYPQEQTGASPLFGYDAAADPVVRAGTHGLFYYSGIVFDRSLARSAAFAARFIDLNNETVEPIRYIDTVRVDHFDAGQAFIDKPWLEVDVPRPGARTVTLNVPQGSGTVSQTVQCGNVYMAWAEITGQAATLRTRIMFSRSTDCGSTWSNPLAISLTGTVGQGATIAVAPATGRVYVAWRQFHYAYAYATVACVREKGFWKDSSNAWPVASLVVGGVSYTKEQALAILQKTYPPSDAPGILAQQLIPAKLNVLSGAENKAIEQVITDADAWLVRFQLGSKPSSAQKQPGLALKDQLEAFNKGLAGTPTCTAAATPYPDAVLVARSDDAGQSFSVPLQVAAVSPFDQGTSEYSFRTNAYPTMAVDETGRAYLAWATRGLATSTANPDPVAGDARIVATTSKDGTTWTTPRPIDQPAKPGHQLFPSLTCNAGKLLLVYNDFRADASGVFERFVVDLLDSTHPMRHTVDVRAAVASPADAPVFTDYSLLKPSTQVSRYPFIVTGSGASDAASLQLQYNPPNLPMFQLGHAPFFGDYLDVAGAPRFVPNGDGTWSYNIASSTAPVYHAVWTDNRDVVGPPDGDWASYIPPGTGHISLFDGSTLVPNCETTSGGADRTQMRNQNIYTSRLTSGLFVAVPSNARPLSPDFQRAFVIFVQNATNTARQFQLQILNQPVGGGSASFEQFGAVLNALSPIWTGAYSSVSQTVFVKSSNAAASVDVRVTELNCGTSCLQSTVRINPDSSNPPPADPTLQTSETYNPAVLNPAVYNPAVYNPAVLNPAVFNPAVFNLHPSNPAVLNYNLGNPAVLNPAVFNPAVLNLAVSNPAVFNPAVLNLAFLNPAVFNPAVLNPAVLNPAVFNPAVFNPAVLNPAVLNPAVFNPAVFNPAVLNPAVFNPAVFNPAVYNGSVSEANFQISNTGNATTAYSLNLNLANQQAGLTYQLMIYRLYFVPVANGCQLTKAANQELLVNDNNPNLSANLLSANGADSFFLNPGETAIATLRIIPNTTSGTAPTFNLHDLSVSVVSRSVNTAAAANGDTQPPVAQILASSLAPFVITTTTLPGGVAGSAYATTLTATGGSGPRVWSAFGALPPGFTLSSPGVLGGTPTTAGSFTFKVRVTDATQLAERSLTVNVVSVAAPAVLTFTVQPANSTGGQPMLPSVAVKALDGAASPVPNVGINIALGTSPCSAATLTGPTTATTDSTGVATFSNLVIGRGGWGYTLTASVTGYPSINVTSNAFNVEGFCNTGSLGTGRGQMPAILLPNGKVLYAGGTIALNTVTATAELFDPSGNSGLGSFAPTGNLSAARTLHQATLLADGRVLVSGGETAGPVALPSAEIYDPTAGTFVPTGSMSTARVGHQATILPNGTVLISGGGGGGATFSSAELFDPTGNVGVGTFTPTGGMSTARNHHTATLLLDGRVLVSGGGPALASAEIYQPATGTFAPTGGMSTPRFAHAATPLPDGKVLITGGHDAGAYLASAELFDPTSGTFSPTGPMGAARGYHASTLLLDGSVLISGGMNTGGHLDTAEIFDPATGTFGPAGTMSASRRDHGAALLPSGKVLIAGGVDTLPLLLSGAELFFPLPPTTFLVTNTADAGAGSLRQAILDANVHPGLDAIHFAIPGTGIQTISPASALPVITDPVLLDATTQPGYAGTPVIRLDGAGLAGGDGLRVFARNSLVQGFIVTRCTNNGIVVSGSGAYGNRVLHNYVGTDGTAALGNTYAGIEVDLSSGTVITGNVVSANGNGIVLFTGATNTTVTDNRVGTNAAGTVALGNGFAGLYVYGAATAFNMIAGNLFSGNGNSAIRIGAGAHHNTITGNRIGSDVGGTFALPNVGAGVWILDTAHHNTIGGTAPGAGNTIVASSSENVLLMYTHDNVVQGNWIGTNSAMAPSLGAPIGIYSCCQSANNVIGGAASGAGNVIAFNTSVGVRDEGNGDQIVGNLISLNGGPGVTLLNATGAVLTSNRIGTDAAGTVAMGNGGAGISLTGTSSGNTIGGPGAGDGNLISSNGSNGITLGGAVTGTLIANNKVGTNAAGTAALGNTGDGIGIYNGASGNTVTDNVIAASTYNGIRVNLATGNTIRHNWIGTNSALAPGLGNANQGISVAASNGTLIGGTNPGLGNVVAFNGQGGIGLESAATNSLIQGNTVRGNTGPGVGILSGTGNAILSNSIFANTGLGIDLGADGVTPNDPGDADTGANDLINFPVLTSAVDNGSRTTVTGSVDVGVPGVTLYLQFFASDACDPSGYGEGQTFVGTASVVTGGGGTASFSANLPTGLLGKQLTATTNTLLGPGGNTSEFSACVAVVSAAPVFGSLSFSSQPSGMIAGQTLAAFSVTARDTTTSPMPGVNVTVAIGQAGCPTCTLSGTTTQTTNGSGIATFSDLVISRGSAPPGYTLVVSATVGSVTLSAESNYVYLNGFRETASMGSPRVGASMTRLADGRVLVVGGVDASNTPLSSAEIYDPTAGSWTPTGSLTLGPRSIHTATLLNNGKVLIAGGSSQPLPASNALATAEIFDPTTSLFSSTSSLNVARMVHTATLLDNGKVLIAGGGSTGGGPYEITAELYDPGADTFSWTGSMTTPRANHTATHSGCGPSGFSESVLLAGGNSAPFIYLASAETYDPATGTFTATTTPMSTPRINHATAFNGFVLVAGGNSGAGTLSTAERFWCGLGWAAWFAPETMSAPREQHTALMFGGGNILLAGGYNASSSSVLSSAEIYDVSTFGFVPTHAMATPRRLHMATNLGGHVLVAGGRGSSGTAIAAAEIYYSWH